MLFSPIIALKKIGIFKNNIELEIKETYDIAYAFSKKNNKIINEKDNISKQIAREIFNTIPQVYGWEIFAPIAKRWCTQFNENSKIIARYDEISECNHNDIVGWSQNSEISKKFSCLIFRDKKIESIYISKRLEFMKILLQDVSANFIEIDVKGRKTLAKMIYAMYMGDFVSCYIAILRKIDPTPVDVIVELKDTLSKI
jgi:glucose/mannose-6-phosphate isomerase